VHSISWYSAFDIIVDSVFAVLNVLKSFDPAVNFRLNTNAIVNVKRSTLSPEVTNYMCTVFTGPPTHSVGGQYCFAFCVCRRRSSVVVCNTLRRYNLTGGGFIRAGQAMTSCRFQSNYSSMVILHGGPVEFRPIRATPCLFTFNYIPVITSGHREVSIGKQNNSIQAYRYR